MIVVQQAASARSTEPAVGDELDRLATMPIVQLRARYREVFRGAPPKAFGPDLLRGSIAHRIQASAYGGLSHQAQRLLDQMVKAYAAKPDGKIVLPRRIKPGSVLVREWKGKSHRVTVLAEGFDHDGKTYTNLSEVAVLITGTRWNGPRFFGLRTKLQDGDESVAPDRSGAAKRTVQLLERSNHLGDGSGYQQRNATKASKSGTNGNRHGR